jgi:hypothetical protein
VTRTFDIRSRTPHVQVQRKGLRVSIESMVKLRRRGHHKFTVQVFDLSMEGCKLEFLETPQLDETVWLKFEGLEGLEATVRWLDANTAGVEFVRPLHPAVFDLLVNRMRSVGTKERGRAR